MLSRWFNDFNNYLNILMFSTLLLINAALDFDTSNLVYFFRNLQGSPLHLNASHIDFRTNDVNTTALMTRSLVGGKSQVQLVTTLRLLQQQSFVVSRMGSIKPSSSTRLLMNLSGLEAAADVAAPTSDLMVCVKFNVEAGVAMVLDIVALMFAEDAWTLVLLLVVTLVFRQTKLW